jgi:hypothetical protein
MELLFVVGLGVYLIGHGVQGLPNTGIIGAISMVVGGILVIVSALA